MSLIHWQKENRRKEKEAKNEQEVAQKTKHSKFNSTFRVDSKNRNMSRMNDWIIDNNHNK